MGTPMNADEVWRNLKEALQNDLGRPILIPQSPKQETQREKCRLVLEYMYFLDASDRKMDELNQIEDKGDGKD